MEEQSWKGDSPEAHDDDVALIEGEGTLAPEYEEIVKAGFISGKSVKLLKRRSGVCENTSTKRDVTVGTIGVLGVPRVCFVLVVWWEV